MINYTERLKKYWKTESLSFIAVFAKFKEKEGFFNDLINPISLKKLRYPEFDDVKVNNKNVSFYIPNALHLIDGHYYKIDLEYADNSKRKNNPYSLQVSSIANLNQTEVENHLLGNTNEDLLKNVFQIKGFIEKEKAKEHIQLRFERLNNPEANKIIANLMREIGKGMYSSKQRMIFELLQNADDAPGKEKVEFHIDTNGDYFFVMHDGVPFSRDDVDAITSAAESTKRKDKKKTGYKGIGFKSVFTDSSEVWLKSGGYQFAFIRNSVLFDDFESFYFNSKDYRDFPELVERHREKYQKDISSYNSLTDIPWQVMPIWQDKLPIEFTDSNFNNFDNPVQFALKVGTNNIFSEDGYLSAIDNIIKRPQFLLFLRNTSKFRSPKNRVTIVRNDDGEIIKIEKSTVEYTGTEGIQKKDVLKYTKQIYSNIQVDNEAFSELNIGIKKIVEKSDLNEDMYHFIDLDGNKIETIPPKLASAIETEISFGISLVDDKISPEKEYKKGLPKYSSLFTYLPMEDTRFQLPFLVNADFVTSSDRQRIQGDNLWNKYIMIKVAEKHVSTLAHFGQEFLNDNDTNSSYLSLLLKDPLPEDDTAQQIIESYNAKYLEQLENTEIIINNNDQIQLLSDTIIDDSGLIELFGNEIFYDIINTEKKLPNSNLDAKYLKDYDYLNVEVIDLEELAEHITPELCESLGNIINRKALYENPNLLEWLNSLVKYIPNDFGKIPFILHNNSTFSLERLIDEEDAWLINEHTSQYETLIGELGYHIIQINLDKYSNIKKFLHSINGYINDRTQTYERIASNENIHTLPVTSKLKLIDFFQNSTFMVGIGETKYFGDLKLFVDNAGNARPIWNLLYRQRETKLQSLKKFRIKKEEFNSLPGDLIKELLAKDEIFTFFILDEDLFEEWSQQFDTKNIDNYVSDLKTMYSWLDNPDNISSSKWASIPWLYIDDEVRFESSDKVYWSKAFKDLSADKFEIVKTVFHSAALKILPVQECGALIKAFPIKTDDSSDIDWSEAEGLEMIVANTLLDWMEVDSGFGDFFQNYTLVADTNCNYEIEKIEDLQIFDGINKELKTYIQSNTELSTLFIELDHNLCSENRSMIGLLQGDRLIKALIESGEYDQNLAVHLPVNISIELLQSFIANLKEFKLFTSKDYGSDTPEHIIVHNILNKIDEGEVVSEEMAQVIEVLKAKTLINKQPLKNFDISNAISFGKVKIIKGLHLSDVLNKYEGDSNVLEEVLESFSQIKNTRKLRKHIFKTRILDPQEIHYEIKKENSTFYSIEQVVFQLLDKSFGNNRKWEKPHFDNHYKENGTEEQLHSSYQKFLDLLIKIDFTDLSDFIFHDLTLSNFVDKNNAIKSEYIPDWLNQWVEIDKENRLQFLSKLGYNDNDSPIVRLRKAMIANDYDENTVIRYFEESKPNMQIIWNTILWLANYNPSIVTQNISVIKQVNDYIRFKADSIKEITIPLIKSINTEGARIYSLQAVSAETELLKINIQSEFSDSIISSLNNSLTNPNCIDESIGELSDYLNITAVELEQSVDIKTLESKSELWEEPFYKKWEHSNDYPIYIYDGDGIPYKRSFKNIIVNTFVQDLKVASEGKYYVSNILKGDLLDYLPDSFPKDKLNELKEWERKTLKDPSLLEENPLEENYSETFDRMIQDRYGISKDRQNDENSNAKRQALYYLKENGYEVNEGHSKQNFAALYGIKDSEDNSIDFIVKSARGGLLFINKSHWEMLDSSQTQLIAIYPKFEMRIFMDKMELLSDELQEKVLFRIPNKKKEREIDDVFDKTESDSHLILVTSKQMKESLFEKVGKKGTFNKNEEANVMDENIVIE